MISRLLIAAFFISMLPVSACTKSGEPTNTSAPVLSAAPTSENVEEVITQLERKWVAAIVGKDTATIDRLLADDFSGTTNDQRYSKADAIEDVTSGTHESLDLEEIDVRVFGDSAVVTLAQNEKSRHGNKDFSGRYLFTNVWVKKDSEWRAVTSHGSRIR
jgi:ketosteroid isomerase-like protein